MYTTPDNRFGQMPQGLMDIAFGLKNKNRPQAPSQDQLNEIAQKMSEKTEEADETSPDDPTFLRRLLEKYPEAAIFAFVALGALGVSAGEAIKHLAR